MALKLAKQGWWQGDPGRVLRAPCDEVVAALQYEGFLSDYETALYELNKERA